MNGSVSILMYHSIARGRGPVVIAPDTFRMQLDTLARCGFRGVALRDYVAAREVGTVLPDPTVILTFDDGYDDFASVALPEVESRGWTCSVFVSSGLVGAAEGWDPDGSGRRRLIDWREVGEVAARGVEIGAHGATHADLTRIPFDRARREIADSRHVIEQRAGCVVSTFAAPYGRTTPAIRREIARVYRGAVGTTLARATADSDLHDLPRIDMWYFRNPARWRAYLEGARGYFALRRVLRKARETVGLGAGPR